MVGFEAWMDWARMSHWDSPSIWRVWVSREVTEPVKRPAVSQPLPGCFIDLVIWCVSFKYGIHVTRWIKIKRIHSMGTTFVFSEIEKVATIVAGNS